MHTGTAGSGLSSPQQSPSIHTYIFDCQALKPRISLPSNASIRSHFLLDWRFPGCQCFHPRRQLSPELRLAASKPPCVTFSLEMESKYVCIPPPSQGDGRAIYRVPWVDRLLHLNSYFNLFCFDLQERCLFPQVERRVRRSCPIIKHQ